MKSSYKVTNHSYWLVAIIILIVTLMLMIVIDLNYYVRKNTETDFLITDNYELAIKDYYLLSNDEATIHVVGKETDPEVQKTLMYLEQMHKEYHFTDQVEDIEMQQATFIVFTKDWILENGVPELQFEQVDHEIGVLFTHVSEELLNQNQEFFGISDVQPLEGSNGVNLLDGFLLGGQRELENMWVPFLPVSLTSTTKTFMEDLDDNPLIWRNSYHYSKIYVMNNDFYNLNAGAGMFFSIMSDFEDDFVYPIVNARVLTYSSFPYYTDGDEDRLYESYTRTALKLQHDILIPDILGVNRLRGINPSMFLDIDYDYYMNTGFTSYFSDQITNYDKSIYKAGGDIDIMYSPTIIEEIELYSELFEQESIETIFLEEEYLYELDSIKDERVFSGVRSVVGPWKNEYTLQALNNKMIYIPVTLEYQLGSENLIDFYSAVTAYGLIVHNLDLDHVVYPENSDINWITVNKDYVETLDEYREVFEEIEPKNIRQVAQSSSLYALLEYNIEYQEDKIEIRIDKWYGNTSFILRTKKSIKSVSNGTFRELEEDVYIIELNKKKSTIELKNVDIYE